MIRQPEHELIRKLVEAADAVPALRSILDTRATFLSDKGYLP